MTAIEHRQTIRIRRATLADMAELQDILQDTFRSTWLPQITPSAAEAFRAEDRPLAYVRERGLQFWVAKYEGRPVGLVDWEDDFVNALHVRSDHARSKIGTRLMDTAEIGIAKAGYKTARLETDTFNTVSQAFYAARGYKEVDRYPDTEWGGELTTVLLVKELEVLSDDQTAMGPC